MKDFIIGHKKEIALITIGVLLIILSFGLGYISGRDLNQVPIIIQKNSK